VGSVSILVELELEGGRNSGDPGEKPSEQHEPTSVGDDSPKKHSSRRARTNNKLNPVR